MSSNASASLTLQYTAPGGTPVSTTIVTLAPYNAMSTGTVDISAGTVSGTSFSLGFGSVASPTGFILYNSSGHEQKLCAQGLSTVPFDVANGAVLMLAQPVSCTALPLSACSFITTTAQVSAGTVSYFVFGDP